MKKFITPLACVTIATILSVAAMTPLVASGRPSQETTKKDKQSSSKAVVKFKPEPRYPESARRRNIEATVVLRAVFRASGEVTDITFDEITPNNLPEEFVKLFAEESIEAARKIKFEPAMKNGRPVHMYMMLVYNFRLY